MCLRSVDRGISEDSDVYDDLEFIGHTTDMQPFDRDLALLKVERREHLDGRALCF